MSYTRERDELRFYHRGELYRVNRQGHINANGIGHFSKDWIFLGGSRHHWSNHIDVNLKAAFEDPKLLVGCLGWDIDHGTTRTWGGCYAGKLPRITSAWIEPHVDGTEGQDRKSYTDTQDRKHYTTEVPE